MRVAGLTLTLNIQQYEYVTQAGDTAGIVAVILPQNQMPFPEDHGILISPGHATSIGIVQVRAIDNITAASYRCAAVGSADARLTQAIATRAGAETDPAINAGRP